MRIIYRTSDNLIVWFEADSQLFQSYLEPIWHDNFSQQMIPDLSYPNKWHTCINGSVSITEPPIDAEAVMFWKSKARTLQSVAYLMRMRLMSFMPPLVGQLAVYEKKASEAAAYIASNNTLEPRVIPFVQMYSETAGISLANAAIMIDMKARQYRLAALDFERERHQLVSMIIQAEQQSQLNPIAGLIQQKMSSIR